MAGYFNVFFTTKNANCAGVELKYSNNCESETHLFFKCRGILVRSWQSKCRIQMNENLSICRWNCVIM